MWTDGSTNAAYRTLSSWLSISRPTKTKSFSSSSCEISPAFDGPARRLNFNGRTLARLAAISSASIPPARTRTSLAYGLSKPPCHNRRDGVDAAKRCAGDAYSFHEPHGSQRQEIGGINLATKTLPDLCRKAHESLQWAVMDRDGL